MIKCAICRGRIRPPKRPWADTSDGFHFYKTDTPMEVYAKELVRLNKTLPFIHERCVNAAAPGTLPKKYLVAQDFDLRVRYRQHKRRTA